MKRIKILTRYDIDNLEEAVNIFIRSNENFVDDVKIGSYGQGQYTKFYAVIFYRIDTGE